MGKWIATVIISALVAISYNTIADLIADSLTDNNQINIIYELDQIKTKLNNIEKLIVEQNLK